MVKQVSNLSNNQAIFKGEQVIAFFTSDTQEHVDFDSYEQVEFKEEVLQIKNTWDIFSLNDKAIQADFDLLTEGRTSQPIPVWSSCNSGTKYLYRARSYDFLLIVKCI